MMICMGTYSALWQKAIVIGLCSAEKPWLILTSAQYPEDLIYCTLWCLDLTLWWIGQKEV